MITRIKQWWEATRKKQLARSEFWLELEHANAYGCRGVVNATIARIWARLYESHMDRDVELDTYAARLVNRLVGVGVPQLAAGDAVFGVLWHSMRCGLSPREALFGVLDTLVFEGARGGTVPVRAESLRHLCEWLPGIRSGLGLLPVQQFPAFNTIIVWLGQEGRKV